MKKYFIFILFILIFNILIIKNNNTKKHEILFYKCNKYVIGKIIKKILNDNNIKRTHNINDN